MKLHGLLITLSLLVSISSSALSQTFRPQIEILMLENPAVLAAAVTIPETRILQFGSLIKYTDVKRFDLRVRGEILHPFEYHPRGYFNVETGVALNYGFILSPPNKLSKGTYIGSWILSTGLESNLDTNRKYHAKNYRFSFGNEQEIPLTDFARLINESAQPAKIRVGVTRLRMMPPVDSSALRIDGALTWQVPLVFGTSWTTTGEGQLAKNVKPYAFLVSGAEYALPIQNTLLPGVTVTPRVFARYVIGKKPPTYELIKSWEYGFTASISFTPSL